MEVRPTGRDRRFMDTTGKLICPNSTFAHWDGSREETPVVDPYPEHSKMSAVLGQTKAAGEFIDWLQSRTPAIHLLHVDERYPAGPDRWNTPDKPLLGLLAEWKDIDLGKIEQEKRAMLEALRTANTRAQTLGLDQSDA